MKSFLLLLKTLDIHTFFGQRKCLFTGILSINRKRTTELATLCEYEVQETVTKKTTIFVSGNSAVHRCKNHGKTSKERKAEDLIAKGQPILILQETDFIKMVSGQKKSLG